MKIGLQNVKQTKNCLLLIIFYQYQFYWITTYFFKVNEQPTMSRKYNNTDNEQQSDAHSSKFSSPRSLKILTKKHKQFMNRYEPTISNQCSIQNSSIVTSLQKLTLHQQKQSNALIQQKPFNEYLMPSFAEKYLPKGATPQEVYEQMYSILRFKQKQIQSLIVYRDELKFISHNFPYEQNIKISLKLLQDKAQIQSKMKAQTYQLLQSIQRMQKQNQNILQYTRIISDHKDGQNTVTVNFIDMHKEKQLMIDNLIMQTMHFIKQLDNEKRKNQKQIKQIQDQIFNYRVIIKDKQDKIRELKAKVCTLYIKMHSRNPQRSGSRDKNMSMSIRKFNIENNETIKEVFIGNTQFKKFSKEMLEKITYKEDLMRIKFFHRKDKLYFQCVYQNKNGILHYPVYDGETSRGGNFFINTLAKNKNDVIAKNQETTKDIMKQLQLIEEVNLRYLMSIKFFFKSSLVGVQCRIKTDRGNKHLQIGNCSPNIENQLITLVNRKIVTLGSYWHGKQMIGIAVWYKDQKPVLKRIQSTNRLKEKEKKMTVDTQDQYYA